jgi:hypothetical protein
LKFSGVVDVLQEKSRRWYEEMRKEKGRRNGQASTALALWFNGRGAKIVAVMVMLRRAITASSGRLWRCRVRAKGEEEMGGMRGSLWEPLVLWKTRGN